MRPARRPRENFRHGIHLHIHARGDGTARRYGPVHRRHERCRQLPQFRHRLKGRPTAYNHGRSLARHHHRRHNLQRHDGGGSQRNVPPRTVHLPRGDDTLPLGHAGKHHPARHIQHAGPSDLDNRSSGLLPARRRHSRLDRTDSRRPRSYGRRPRAIHQLGTCHGHRRRNSPLGSHSIRLRRRRHVSVTTAILVPIPPPVQPLRRRMVRNIGHGNHIFRTLQGPQRRSGRIVRHTIRRAQPAVLTLHSVVHKFRRALLPSAIQGKHPQGQHSGRYIRSRSGLRRKRPRELHRRTRRGLRLLHARPRERRYGHAHGSTGRSRSRKGLPAARSRRHHDHHAVDITPRPLGKPHRALALEPERGARTIRLDASLARIGTYSHGH